MILLTCYVVLSIFQMRRPFITRTHAAFDLADVFFPAWIHSGDGVPQGNDPVVARRGFVDGGADAVAEPCARDGECRDGALLQQFVQAGFVKTSPAWLVEDAFVVRDGLRFSAEQTGRVEADTFRKQALYRLCTVRVRGEQVRA